MRQVTQRPRDGRIETIEVPEPSARPEWVVVDNRYSLISAGTERTKLDFGRKTLLGKARARPDLARKVVDRARVEGVRSALALSRDRLDRLAPLGYSSAGIVRTVGAGVESLAPGDAVACAGAGWANHAEVVAIPKNLVARVPKGVSLDDAAYATVGAIALHAVRQSDARVGESVGVVGLGLVGQIAVRILKAAGCIPFGVDVDSEAVALARSGGVVAHERQDPALEQAALHLSHDLGLDAVIVCAAVDSADPIELSATLARDRGRVILVGDVPLTADRRVFYEKELELRLSRSYGPGRYDRDYEEHGRDLPAGYVRWTEQRNLQAFIDLIASGAICPSELTTHRLPVERAEEAFALLEHPVEGERPFGVLLEYPETLPRRPVFAPARRSGPTGARVGLIGAGSFARSTLVPALKEAGAELAVVHSAGGLSAADLAEKMGFENVADSIEAVIADDTLNAVVVATRHADHAALAVAILESGKAAFIEKPLALTATQLDEVEAALAAGGSLMVGFNRRFAPLTERLGAALEGMTDVALTYRINAGPLAADHWLGDPEEGGGRILGEACHFVDLLSHLARAPVASVYAACVPQAGREVALSDTVATTLRFQNSLVGSLVYSGGGDPKLPKERIEALGGGLSAVLDDFRRLELYRGTRTVHKGAQDKGHRAQLRRFVAAMQGHAEFPDAGTYLASTRATLAVVESLRTGLPVAAS